MLRAVFVRTLKPGVTYDEFKAAWMPEGMTGRYPVKAWLSRNIANDRQVITIFELDVAVGDLTTTVAALVRPDAKDRVAELVESTQLEAVFEDVFDQTSL
jgi:hypothetical protein